MPMSKDFGPCVQLKTQQLENLNVGGGEQMINWSFLAHTVFGMEVHFVPIHIASSRNGFRFQPHTRPTYLCCLNMPSLKDLRWYHFCNSSLLERPEIRSPGIWEKGLRGHTGEARLFEAMFGEARFGETRFAHWEFCPKFLSNWLNQFMLHFKKVGIMTENC